MRAYSRHRSYLAWSRRSKIAKPASILSSRGQQAVSGPTPGSPQLFQQRLRLFHAPRLATAVEKGLIITPAK
jgi:hypothetical protein